MIVVNEFIVFIEYGLKDMNQEKMKILKEGKRSFDDADLCCIKLRTILLIIYG